MELVYFTEEDLAAGAIDPAIISRSHIIILDDMYRSHREYVLGEVDFSKTRVYGLATVANNPNQIISDTKVKAYARPLTRNNLSNLIGFLMHRQCGPGGPAV